MQARSMATRARLRLPLLEDIPVVLSRAAENLVDALAKAVEPLIPEEDPRWRKAIAYALVGDLVASPLPPPLDAPLDAAVSERLLELVPEISKYKRISAKIAESIPYIELLPTYLINVMAARREAEGSQL